MSTYKFVGDEAKGGIPRKANVRVEALPKKQLVFEGQVSEAAYLDLDPGKYIASIVRLSSPKRLDDCCYVTEFFHEIEQPAWEALQRIEPRLTKTIHTSNGVRWRCQFLMCDFEATNPTAAVIHEVEHFGVPREEFLKDPKGAAGKIAGQKVAEYEQTLLKNRKAAGKISSPIPR